MSFPPAVPGDGSHPLSPAALRDAETDLSVRAGRARLAGNDWEFDYAALHSRANAIKMPAGRTRRKEAPLCPALPADGPSPFLPPQPLPCPQLHTLCPGTSQKPQSPARSEGRRRRRWQRATTWPHRAPTSLHCPLCPACACDPAPLLYVLPAAPSAPLSGLSLAPWHRTACEMC